MTNAELAAYLNAEVNLTGSAAVTGNVIRQWVSWGVLPHAIGRGRGYAGGVSWERTERDLKRALQLASWRAAGVRRQQSFIVHAYVAWGYRDWERVREALATELLLASASVRQRITTSLQFRSFWKDVSQTRKRAFRTQLGPLDHRLKETQFELSPELYAVAAQAAFQPPLIELEATAAIDEYISHVFPILSPFAVLVSPSIFALINSLFASEDETEKAAISAIRDCSERELRSARLLLRQLYKSVFPKSRPAGRPTLDKGLIETLEAIGPQITMGNWRIVGVASAIRLIQAGTIAQLQADINPELLSYITSNLL